MTSARRRWPVARVVLIVAAVYTGPAAGTANAGTANAGTATAGTATAGTAAPGTSAVRVPPMPASPNADPRGISCVSATFCMSVGSYVASNGLPHPLAQRWDGTSWHSTGMPGPAAASNVVVTSVACPSATRCVAVGFWADGTGYHALAHLWNGTAWSLLTTPAVSGVQLQSVSCWGTNGCLATGTRDVGSGLSAVSERWNGAQWITLSTPEPSGASDIELSGVSCVSVTRCVAVGRADDAALAEAWTGTHWSTYATPHPATSSGLFSVSCSSSANCMAVGMAGVTEQLVGTSWHVRTTPSGTSDQLGVSCKSGACLAVGNRGARHALHWNGTSWAALATPGPGYGFGSGFAAVACTSSTACLVAGRVVVLPADETTPEVTRSLYERWSGGTWALTKAVDPRGAVQGALHGVSCGSATSCMAVGAYGTTSLHAFADVWNGSAWVLTSLPPTVAAVVLNGVACFDAATCIAVGSQRVAKHLQPLALRWSSSTWTVIGSPAYAGDTEMSSVACVALSVCLAVGVTNEFTASQRPAAMAWHGVRFRLTTPVDAGGHSFSSISCWPLVEGCLAVGPLGLAESWNSISWTRIAVPAGTDDLNGVSCPELVRCVAVGRHGSTAQGLTWDNGTWTASSMPDPAGGTASIPLGVSCVSLTACTAVGAYCAAADPTTCDFLGPDSSLTELWNGAWSAVATPAPSRSSRNALAGVSCLTATTCVSVGWAQRWFTIPYALHRS